MSSRPLQGENILLKTAVLIVIGVGVGIADAFVVRPINTKANVQPSVTELINGLKPKAAQPSDGTAENGVKTPVKTPDGPVNGTKPDSSNPAPTPPEPSGRPSREGEPTPLKQNHITLAQAYALYQSDPRGEAAKVIFIDARSMDKYETGHVTGSYPLGLESFKDGDPPQIEWLRSMGPDVVYVVYCLGGDCHESEEVALQMNNMGFKTTYIMHDGIPAWKAAGYPMEEGKHPLGESQGFR